MMNRVVQGDDGEEAWQAARQRGFLRRLPADVVDTLIRQGVVVRHAARTRLPAPDAAVVVGGLLRSYMTAGDGRQITLRYLGPGDLIGAVLPTAQASFQMVQASTLLHLDAGQLWACAEENPQLALALAQELSARLRHAYHTLAYGLFATVRSRVARDLVERARAAGARGPAVHLRLTQQELADATGSVREVVTRALGELRRLGLVTTDHSEVVILDLRALAREAASNVEVLPDAA